MISIKMVTVQPDKHNITASSLVKEDLHFLRFKVFQLYFNRYDLLVNNYEIITAF